MSKQTSLSRRGFLKGSTGAGLLLCSSQVAFGYKANEKLNVACIGVGGQGVSNTRGVSGEHVVAVCDVDEKRAAQMLKQYSGTKRCQAQGGDPDGQPGVGIGRGAPGY